MKKGLLLGLIGVFLLPLTVSATETVTTNFGGHTQIWFRADSFDEKNGDVATVPEIIEQGLGNQFEVVDQSLTQNPVAFYGDSVRQEQHDWWLEYNFDLPQGGTWYIWARAAQNSPTTNSLGSHWIFVIGDNDGVYPAPGEITLDYFLMEWDRMFGDRFKEEGDDALVGPDMWDWVGLRSDYRGLNDLGDPRYPLPKFFVEGENSMRIYERESGDPSVQFEIFVISDVDYTDYIPTDTQAMEALGLSTIGTVERSFPAEYIVPGETLAGVQLALTVPQDKTFNVTVIETAPEGWDPSNLQWSAGNAAMENGNIVWTLENVSADQTLTYDVTPPAGALVGTFSGEASFGEQTTLTGGTSSIQKEVSFAGVNDTNPSAKPLVDGEAFFEESDAYLETDTEEPAFEILIDESRANNLYANTAFRNDESINELRFYFEVSEPGLFGAIASVRNPNTSQDSWFVAMDDEFINTENTETYRFQGASHLGMNNEEFHKMWVRTDGIEDLTWDLTSGVHYLRFKAREEGSHLDWVLITNNFDQAPEAVEPPVTGIQDFMLY